MFYGTQFFMKKYAKFDTFWDLFLQKINVLRFKIVSNRNISKNYNQITAKTQFKPVFEISKFFKNFTPKTPKIHILLHLRKRCFMGQKADFVLLETHPLYKLFTGVNKGPPLG